MFLTTVNLAKAKSKTVLVQMMSAAGTGYCFNTKRNRLREKMVLRKHDPFVDKHVLFFEKRKIKSI
ncbi:large ribosomal subunit protein bL33m [Centroberyx gerrardi]|uniref:large ribosomal subunit protein bL33m n=1 Tax=Centroberyx gerrardi TaxID=166262 RepID=UPI003AB035F5